MLWFVCAAAGHDFPPVHLRPRWSGSCCHCDGETTATRTPPTLQGWKMKTERKSLLNQPPCVCGMCLPTQMRLVRYLMFFIKDRVCSGVCSENTASSGGGGWHCGWVNVGVLLWLVLRSVMFAGERIAVDGREGILAQWERKGLSPLPVSEAPGMSCRCHGNREKKGSEIVANITR